MAETFGGVPDFPGGEVVTMSVGGSGRLIKCMKCPQCGYSVTAGAEEDIRPLLMPWPDKSLSPNARIHWAKKASIVKRQRQLAYALAITAGWHRLKIPEGRIHLWMDFYPPTRRMPDDDNLLISMKPARDGIAEAMGIDDKRFVSHPFVRDEPIKGGEVRIRISAGTRT